MITEGAVDLGLSVKWAACDLGSSQCYVEGTQFEWGDQRTECLANICGTSYDQAYKELGGGWRLPTKAQAEELIEKCRIVKGSYRGFNGFIITGPSGNAIFIEASHWLLRFDRDFWTGSCDIMTNKAYYFYFYDDFGKCDPAIKLSVRNETKRIRPVYIY